MEFADARILLINANDPIREADCDIFVGAGFSRVMEAREPPIEGLIAAASQYDVVIVDWASGGAEIVRAMRAEDGPTRYKTVIGISSSAAPELAVEALREAGANGWIVRPISAPARRIRDAIERAAATAAEAEAC